MANRILDHPCRQLAAAGESFSKSAKSARLARSSMRPSYETELKNAVAEVVQQQKEAGVDLINDGELAHTMGWAYDYGSWWSYVIRRLGGVEVVDTGLWFTKLSAHTQDADGAEGFRRRRLGRAPGHVQVPGSLYGPAVRLRFARAVHDQPQSRWSKGRSNTKARKLIQRDIANLKAGLKAAGLGTEGAWMNSIAPASCARMPNEYYKSEEELLYACADAMHEEYKAIIDAGFIVQLDDPAIGENWDQQKNEPSVEGYRRYTKMQIDALNHSIKGLPSSKIRFHLCWGSWHGPHTTDIPMKHLVDLMLAVNADYYSFEAANARHEHEWKLWKDIKLPAGKKILPGVVTPFDQPDRASRTGRRPHLPFRRGGGGRERDRFDRLRTGRPRPPADRLGQAQGAVGRRRARLQAALLEGRGVSRGNQARETGTCFCGPRR